MGADRIDHGGLLANEQMAGTMEHQAALLLGRLGLDEPHVCSGDRLADGFSVGSIVLLPLDIGLHVSRRHQAHGVAERLEFARPIMRRCAGFDTNQARRHLLEKRQDIAALQLTADDHIVFRVDAVHLKNRLCDVKTDCCDRLHDWLLQIVDALTASTSTAFMCRWRSRPQHQERSLTERRTADFDPGRVKTRASAWSCQLPSNFRAFWPTGGAPIAENYAERVRFLARAEFSHGLDPLRKFDSEFSMTGVDPKATFGMIHPQLGLTSLPEPN